MPPLGRRVGQEHIAVLELGHELVVERVLLVRVLAQHARAVLHAVLHARVLVRDGDAAQDHGQLLDSPPPQGERALERLLGLCQALLGPKDLTLQAPLALGDRELAARRSGRLGRAETLGVLPLVLAHQRGMLHLERCLALFGLHLGRADERSRLSRVLPPLE